MYTTQNSSLPSNNIWKIAIDSNNVKFIATANGLVKIDGMIWTVYDTVNYVPLNSINSIAVDMKNNIWIGTLGKGILKYNGESWTTIDTINSQLISNYVTKIFVDNYNIKWIGTVTKGLIKFNDSTWTDLYPKKWTRS